MSWSPSNDAAPRRLLGCLAVAIAMHLGVALVHSAKATSTDMRPAGRPPIDVTLEPEKPAAASDEPAQSLRATPTPASMKTHVTRVNRAAASLASARAPATDSVPAQETAGNTGTSSRSADGALSNPADGTPSHAPSGTMVPPRRARLATGADRCKGLFPVGARNDFGTVVVALRVGSSGNASLARVLSESPPSQGFAGAAATCAPRLGFEPATDEMGLRVNSESVVRLRFARAD